MERGRTVLDGGTAFLEAEAGPGLGRAARWQYSPEEGEELDNLRFESDTLAAQFGGWQALVFTGCSSMLQRFRVVVSSISGYPRCVEQSFT